METPPPLREGSETISELAQHPSTATEPSMAAAAEVPALLPYAPEPHPFQRASPASVQQAIDEVSGVIDTLRGALEEMEEVLEMLEVLERQSSADEQEIESLRRTLRQMHRPREGGHPAHR